MKRRIAFILLAMCYASARLHAQQAPELGYLFPPAVERGKTTNVQLGGYDFTPDMQYFVHEPKVQLEVTGELGDYLVPGPPYWFGEKSRLAAFPIPREIDGRLSVAADARPGIVRWQVANANGASATANLLVSDIAEIVEQRYRDEAQQVERFPIGISGRLARIAEVDRYSFIASKTGLVSIELFARRLGANLNGVLEVRDDANRVIATTADTEGHDTLVVFAAKQGSRYRLRLHDVDFRGNRAFIYRLEFRAGPRVFGAEPAFGQRGKQQKVRIHGIGVKSGAAEWESVETTIKFPAAPDAATFRYRLATPSGAANPLEIPLSNHVESAGTNETLQAPIGVTSKLVGTVVTHQFQAKKGVGYRIDAMSHAIGGDLDLALEIQDGDGKRLASNDDLPGTPDAGLDFKPKTDGVYRCLIRDLSGDASPTRSFYRLAIQETAPAVTLSVPQRLAVKVGAVTQLTVTANRRGGHKAAIDLRIVGLPAGVTAPEKAQIAEGKKSVKVPLTCAATAATTATTIQVLGISEGRELTATAPAAGDLSGPHPAMSKTSSLMLATTLTPEFSVELVDKNRQRAVHRGTTYPAPFVVKRNEGFTGEIVLRMAAKQGRHRQGIHSPEVSVPNGSNTVLYPCFMPEWLETDRTTRMVVLGVGMQKDPQGNLRHVTKSADARVTMILEGALLSVRHETEELTVIAGNSFEIPVLVSRSAKLREPVTLRLIVPDELQDLIIAKDVSLAAQEARGVLKLATKADSRLRGRWKLKLEAHSLQASRWPVLSQTEVTVEFRAAPSGASD